MEHSNKIMLSIHPQFMTHQLHSTLTQLTNLEYFTKMYWLLGRKSELSTNSKLLNYKIILKPIWTYGIQLWGTT
jgi:hypothetical protein